MNRGSRSSCHRNLFTVFAVAVCVVVVLPAATQTRTHFASSITSESMTAVWVARERGLLKMHGLDAIYRHAAFAPLAIAAVQSVWKK